MTSHFAALAVGVLLISAPAGTAPSGDRSITCDTAFQTVPTDRDRQPAATGTDSRTLETGQQQDFIASSCRTTPRGRQEVLLGSHLDTAMGSFLVSAVVP